MATRKKAVGSLRDYIRQVMRGKAASHAGTYTQFRREVIESALNNYKPTPSLVSVACGYHAAYKQLLLEGLVMPKCLTKAGRM